MPTDRCTRPAKQHKWEKERELDDVIIYRCAFCLGLRYKTRAKRGQRVGKWKYNPAPTTSIAEAMKMALKSSE